MTNSVRYLGALLTLGLVLAGAARPAEAGCWPWEKCFYTETIPAAAKTTYNTVTTGVQTLTNAAGTVVNAAYNVLPPQVRTGIDAFRDVVSKGFEFCLSTAGELLKALGLLNTACESLADALGKLGLNPITGLITTLTSNRDASETCSSEFNKGFLCDLLGSIHEVGSVMMGSINAARQNQVACTIASAPPFFGAGYAACGFYYYARPKVEKMARCLGALSRDQLLAGLLESAWKVGCKIIGKLAADAVITAVSAGSGFPAVVAKWIKRLGDLLSPAELLGITGKLASKTVDGLIDYAKDVAGNMNECKELGGDAPKAPMGGIEVKQATYGRNAGAGEGNVSQSVQQHCAAKATCDASNGLCLCNYKVDHTIIGDPAPGQAKSFDVKYRCGDIEKTASLSAEASGQTITLACSGIQVQSANYGWNSCPASQTQANLDRVTGIVRQACDYKGSCAFKVDYTQLGDTAPGCMKTFAVWYWCGETRRDILIDGEAHGKTVHLRCY